MLGNTYDTQICSIARALELVGERWSLLIIRDALFGGVTRFGDFRHNLGIATNILNTRLDAFVENGIMERRKYSEKPEQYEYLLTTKGRELGPALVALTHWGDRWAAPAEPPVRYVHATCDGAISQQLVCATCGSVHADDVAVRQGPGMPAEYLATRRPQPAA